MTLRQAISTWDGKSAPDIGEIYRTFAGQTDLIEVLIACLHDIQLQDGATWLLKKHLETGAVLEKNQIDRILQQLPEINAWQSRLHLLQGFEHFNISSANQLITEQFLRRCLVDDNKFVRAWSYHGFYHLQRQYPQYNEEIKSFFALAMEDEAASVKARIRNINKQYQFNF